MRSLIKSERLIYIIIAAIFVGAFTAVYTKTEQKLDTIKNATPIIVHDVTVDAGDEKTVYITPSGKKYHIDGCDYLSEKKIAVSFSDAINAGYESCRYCQP